MTQNILLRNNVNISGSSNLPVMVFAHGFGCDQNMWRFITPAFQDNYRIVLFDYVGSGRSDRRAYHPEKYASLDGYAQDVLDVCHALDLKDIVFVGHSVSSMIGMLASIKEPNRFEHLILIGPSPCYINDPPDYIGGFDREDIEGLLGVMERNYLGWASFLAPVVMKNPDRSELTAELEESFCSTDPDTARRFAEATFLADNRRDLPKVTVPSLIMQCSEDAIAPCEVGQYLHRSLWGSTLRLMEATCHCPHMSHPEETVAIIKEYLHDAKAR